MCSRVILSALVTKVLSFGTSPRRPRAGRGQVGGGYQVRLFLAWDTLDVVLADRRWKLQSFQFRIIKPPFTAVSGD